MAVPDKPRFKLNLFRVLIYSLLVLPSLWALFQKGYFYSHDDIQILRLQQMSLCFDYLQLPCRWVSDFGAGFGHPLFNYHPPLPYYAGMIFKLFGFTFIDTAKLLFSSSLYFSGLFFLLFASLFFTFPLALAGSLLFVYAPYHALDVYVRGALTEAWGLIFFPLILYSLYRYLKAPTKKLFTLSALSLTGLFLSHPILTLVFTPLALIWALLQAFFLKTRRYFPLLAIFATAFCLSSFFLLPAFLERGLVSIDFLTTNYYNFADHFVTFRQLFFSRLWGWGPSRLGADDEISFQIGWPHWWLAALTLLSSALYFFRHRRLPQLPTLTFFSLLFLFSVFLTHARSFYFWQLFPLLSFVQFPWRFLALVIFSSSFLALFLANVIPSKFHFSLSLLIITLTLLFNLGYFITKDQNSTITDQTMLTGQAYLIQSKATLMDYVPIKVKSLPQSPASDKLSLADPVASTSALTRRSHRFSFTVSNPTDNNLPLDLDIFDFPTWNITTSTGSPISYTTASLSGTLKLNLPPGEYEVNGVLTDTPLRRYSNLLTLFTTIGLLTYLLLPNKNHEA